MARDETVRERDPERPLLDRRSYLRLAGVAAASVAVAGASESADAADHDANSVPADESRSSESSRDSRADADQRFDADRRSGPDQRFDDHRPEDVRTSPEDVASS